MALTSDIVAKYPARESFLLTPSNQMPKNSWAELVGILREELDGILNNLSWNCDAMDPATGAYLVYVPHSITNSVSHSRYMIFQMAEAAVPRMLFWEILDRIRQLRFLTIPARPG